MKVLQFGAGSMGKRRMRDLSANPEVELRVWDSRHDRQRAAAERFGVSLARSSEDGFAWGPDAVIVSTPPDQHSRYVELSLEYGRNFFSEADIWPFDYRRVERVGAEKALIAAPSCTLYFSSIVREVRRVVTEELGHLHAFGYFLSVDGPGWHPGEGEEYYARHRSMAPAREMVAFELIALDYIFGAPADVAGRVTRRGALEMKSEDTWSLQMKMESGAIGQLVVAMACPQTVRRGWAAGDNGSISFDLTGGTIDRAFPNGVTDTRRICDWAADLESVYAEEIATFIAAVEGECSWPYSYRRSSLVCGALAATELSALTGRVEPVSADLLPAEFPDAYPPGRQ
jgi:predicted dehydrogenase